MNSILGVIITFNPDIKILKNNIKSIIDEVESILIIDNGSQEVSELFKYESSNIKIINNNQNLGIAEALNQALNYAIENCFEYILTMDQDSFFENQSVEKLYLGFKDKNTAIVCPSLKDLNSLHTVSTSQEYLEIFATITSGCLCNVSILEDVGGFESKLFIDYVDFEMNLRLQKNGYKIYRARDSILCHHLGDSKIYSFFRMSFISTNHSSLRRFYYARNKVYIYKKYFIYYPVYVLRDFFSLLKTSAIILLFERNKINKMKMIVNGIWQGILMK